MSFKKKIPIARAALRLASARQGAEVAPVWYRVTGYLSYTPRQPVLSRAKLANLS